MPRQHPHPRMSIPISMDVWQQLLGGTHDSGYQKEDWEIAAEAIDEWTRRHRPETIAMPLIHGYQWKSVFLPDGTLLRTVFGGKNYHCQVENDRILYNGQAVSPSGFVNAVGGIRRNAWRCTWILFPDSKDWKLADTLRTHERPRSARQPARDIQLTPAAQPAAASVPDNVPPVAAPLPAQRDAAAANASETSHAQRTLHDRIPANISRANERNRRRSTGITLSPPGCTCGTDRRMNADDRMAALLRRRRNAEAG